MRKLFPEHVDSWGEHVTSPCRGWHGAGHQEKQGRGWKWDAAGLGMSLGVESGFGLWEWLWNCEVLYKCQVVFLFVPPTAWKRKREKAGEVCLFVQLEQFKNAVGWSCSWLYLTLCNWCDPEKCGLVIKSLTVPGAQIPWKQYRENKAIVFEGKTHSLGGAIR